MQYLWAILLGVTWIGAVPLTEEQVSRKGPLSKGLESRIINGHKAKLGQFPWQVAIFIPESDDRGFLCGGSLIDDQWVLTAAHCLDGAQFAKISLGTTLFADFNMEDDTRREFLASEFYVHSKHKLPSQDANDIALIKLPTPVDFNDFIQPIKLANKRLPSGSQVVTSGWGITHEGKPTSNDLLFARMATVSDEECKKVSWIPGVLCAKGVQHESICSGDSGGPLVFYGTNKTPFLVGVASYVPYDKLVKNPEKLCGSKNPTTSTLFFSFKKRANILRAILISHIYFGSCIKYTF